MTDPNRWLQGAVGDKRVLRLLRAGKSLRPTPGAVDRGWAEFVALTGFVPPDGSGGGTSGAGPSDAAGLGTAGTAGAGAAGTGAATAKVGFTTAAVVKAFGLGAALGVGVSVGLTLVDRASSIPSAPSPTIVAATPTPSALEIVRAAPSAAVEAERPLAAPASSAVGPQRPSPTLQPARRTAPSVGSSAPESSVGSFPLERAVETSLPLAARASSAAGGQATAVGSFPVEPALPANLLKLEAADVAQVRALLGSGRAGEALKLLAASSARFPRGPLAEEREALTVEALARSGQSDAARDHAASFEAKHPMSPLLARVRSLVAP